MTIFHLHHAKVLDALAEMPSDHFDGCLTDPPYHLKSSGTGGFMGKAWDGGDVAFRPETWREVLRVLKPGANLLAFGGTRTYHRLAVAIEDAGFELYDSIAWIHGQGFPKALDIGKAIDTAAGIERPVAAVELRADKRGGNFHGGSESRPMMEWARTTSGSAASAPWEGYKTALKPAFEPVIVARKPCAGTFAENALAYGVAGLNIEAGRIGTSKDVPASASRAAYGNGFGFAPNERNPAAPGGDPGLGRYPANVILSHSPDCVLPDDEVFHVERGGTVMGARGIRVERLEARCAPGCPVAELDRQSGELQSGANPTRRGSDKFDRIFQRFAGQEECTPARGSDAGGASRFFYVAKVSAAERAGSKHPTLKPIDLCRYLAALILPSARRVTVPGPCPACGGDPDRRPPGDCITCSNTGAANLGWLSEERRLLVPFSGAGSEMIGAGRAGWEEVVGIEMEQESIEDAERRIRGDAPLFNVVEVRPRTGRRDPAPPRPAGP